LPKPGISRRELADFAIVTEPHRFSPRYACLGEKSSTKSVIPSIEKSRLVMVNGRFGGFDSRDIDSEMMGKPRAIAAIEPIKGDTVFVADSVGRVDG
jgi:hypothetical protein